MKTFGDSFWDDLKPSRRDVVKYGAAAAISAAAMPVSPIFAAASSGTVSGNVYENRSGGVRQTSDPGIAGVLVSNGRDVVKTDAAGRYTLPVEDESIIFVIKPTGYAVPVDEEMLPGFYYIHQPAGSPESLNLRYRGIDPTGPLPDSVDFALRKADEPQKFDVIVFTDPQPESEVEVNFIRDDVVNSLIGNSTAAFGMTTGDIMFDDLSLYPRLNRIIGQIGLPWYNIGGNHDLNYEAPSAKYSRETFKRTYGPPYYAFEYGGTLFLMLDNINYLGFDASKPRGGGKFEGRIGERQLAFIANVLKEFPADKLVVTCMHIPLQTYLDPTNPMMNTVDRGAFLKLLAGRPHTVSLSGHIHTTEHHYFGAEDGFAGTMPHHHHVMTAVSGSCGAALTIIAALPSPTVATVARTVFIFCRSMDKTIRRAFNRPSSRLRGKCASCSTLNSTATARSFTPNSAWGSCSARHYLRKAHLRRASSSIFSTAARAHQSSIVSAGAIPSRWSASSARIPLSRRFSLGTRPPRNLG